MIREKRVKEERERERERRPRVRNCGSDRGAEEEEVETGARETRRSERGRRRVYERPRETERDGTRKDKPTG